GSRPGPGPLAGDGRTTLDLRPHLALRRDGRRGPEIIEKKNGPPEGFRAGTSHCWQRTITRSRLMSNAARVEALFFAALEQKTPAERAAFRAAACGGDAELRRQVEKMLNAHARVGDFLRKPAVERILPERADGTDMLGSTDGPGGHIPLDFLR